MRVLGLFLSLALILQSGGAAAQFSIFNLRNSLVQFALDQLSVPGSFEIQAGEVARDEDGFTELQNVTIADSDGVWFEADALILSWNASRVLRGELVINRLGARGVDVLRRPNPSSLPEAEEVEVEEPPAEPGPFGFEWPRAPLTTIIDELVLTDVEIAPDVVAEQGIAFDATGAARDVDSIQAADLRIERTDDVGGLIFLEYLRNFEDNQLTLDLEATEEAGGLVASVLGLPEESASSVDIYASGPLEDWRLAFRAQAERLLDVQGQAEVDLNAPVSVALTATVAPGEALDPQTAAALSPFTRVVLRAEENERGVVIIEEAEITAPGIAFDLSGAYARSSGALDAEFQLAIEEGISELVDGVDFERIAFAGSATGALDDLTASGDLQLSGLETASVDVGSAALDLSVTREGERIGFDVSGETSGLRLDRLSPETVGDATLIARGAYDGDRLTLDAFSLDSPLLTARAEGALGVAPGTEPVDDGARLTYSVTAPALAPIASAYDVDASGAASVEGAATGALTAPRLVGEATLQDLTFEGESYGRVGLEHDVTLGATPSGRVALQASGSPYGPVALAADFQLGAETLALSDFTASGVGAQIEGAVEVELATNLADGRLSFRIGELADLEGQTGLALQGAASGEIVLQPVDGEQSVVVDASGEDVRGFGVALDSFLVDATVARALTAPQGSGVVSVDGLTAPGDVRVASLRFEGEAELVGDDLVADGLLTGRDIAAAGAEIGSLRVVGEGRELLTAPAADVTLAAQNVAYAAAEAVVGSLTFEGTARDLAEAPEVTGDLIAEAISIGGEDYGRVALDARAVIDDTPEGTVALTATGSPYGPIDVSTGFRLAEPTLTLSDLRAAGVGAVIEGDVTTNLETNLTDGRLAFRVGDLAELEAQTGLALQGAASGTIVLEAEDGEQTIDVDASGEDVRGFDVALDGFVIDATVRQALSAPQGSGVVSVEGLTAPGEVAVGSLRFEGEAEMIGETLAAEGVLTGEALAADGATIASLRLEGEGTDLLDSPLVQATLSVEGVAYPEAEAQVASLLFEGTARNLYEAPAAQGTLRVEGIEAAGAEIATLTVLGSGEDLIAAPAVDVTLTAEGVAYPPADARIATVTFEGTGRNLAEAPALVGDLRAGAIRYQGEDYGRLTAQADVTLGETPEGTLALDAEGSPYGPAAVDGRFRLADGTLTVSEFEALVAGAALEGDVAVDLDTNLADGRIAFEIADLSALEAADARLALDGDASGVVRLAVEDGEQTVIVDASGADVSGFEHRVESFEIDGTVRRALSAPQGEALVSIRNLRGPDAGIDLVRLDATAEQVDGRLVAEATATADGVRVAGATLDALRLDASGTDLLGAPAAEATLSVDGLAYPEAEVSVASLRFEGSGENLLASPDVRGTLTASGVAAPGADVASLEAEFSGENLLEAPVGRVEARIGDIAAAGFRVARATLDATARQEGGGTTIDADLTAGPVSGDGLSVGSVALDATVADALSETPRIDAEARVSALAAAGYNVATVTASTRGPLLALDLSVNATGTTPDEEPLEATARARANLAAQPPVVTVTVLDASAGPLAARITQPARVTLGDATRIDGLALEALGGTVAGDVALWPNGLVGDLAVDFPNLKPAAEAASLPIDSGGVSATADFDTRPGSARARVDVVVRDLTPAALEAVPGGLDATIGADWNGRILQTDAVVSGPFENPLRASVALALRPTSGLVPAPPTPAPIEGSVNWNGRLGDLWALVPVPDLILDGDANVALAFDGTLQAPEIAGDVSLADGSLQYLTTGTILTNLTLDSEIAPGGAFRVRAEATDGASGPVTAEAEIADGALDARIVSRRAVLVRRDDATASVTATVEAVGPLVAPALSGDVRIDRAEIRLVNATPPSVATLGDVRIAGEEVEEEDENGEDGAITLDFDISGTQIFVRGRGLDSQWEIDLDVDGTANRPIIVGDITAQRGQLDLIGFPFDLTRGRVIFDGGREIDPRLDIALFRENDGVVGGVVVDGLASDPQVGFESTPALPEEEVLPRVLFGTSTQGLSSGQAIQLAAGLAALVGGGGGPIDSIRSATGLDVLRFDQSEGGAGVTAGSNLSEDVFVGVRQPLDGGSARVAVEVEVLENVTVDTEIGADSNSVGLNWRLDF